MKGQELSKTRSNQTQRLLNFKFGEKTLYFDIIIITIIIYLLI